MQTVLNSLKALTVAGILGMILSVSSAAQAQDVTVELTSGETYTASVDERTDADYLWLSFEGAGATLLRPVAWDSIATVELSEVGQEELAGDSTFAELAQAALAVQAPAVEGDIEAILAN